MIKTIKHEPINSVFRLSTTIIHYVKMQVQFQNLPTDIKSKVAVFLICDNMIPSQILDNFSKTHDQIITKFLGTDKSFKGKIGDISVVAIQNPYEITTLLLAGVGKPENLSRRGMNLVGAHIATKLNSTKIEHADIYIEDNLHFNGSEDVHVVAAYIAEGIKLRNYKFTKHFVDKKSHHELTLKSIQILTDNYKKAERKFERYSNVADGVMMTRDLVSEPGNVIYPDSFAKRCQEMTQLGLNVRALLPEEMMVLGMGSLMAVGQGSTNKPRLVAIEWWGSQRGKDAAPLAVVGKGVTFDSGGINLKSTAHITDMKYDMGGAAVVTGLMKTLAEQKVKTNVIGLLGLAENMVSGDAQRPGDVVKSMSGQTIEVDNTDAEGRMVLADVLWYAQEEYKCDAIIDLATLTGAIVIALGDEYAGLFSNNNDIAEKLRIAGEEVGELLWRLPLSDHYDGRINSEIADIRNTGKVSGGGAITAAQFLQRFIQEKTVWAHLDIAGVTWTTNGELSCGLKGATGFGVRLLENYIQKHRIV